MTMFCWRINSSNSFSRYLLRTSISGNASKLQTLQNAPTNLCDCCNYQTNKYFNFISFNKLHNNGGTLKSLAMFSSDASTEELDQVTYESICGETLDSLCEFFEDIIERIPIFKTADVCFGDGVLTVNLDSYGIYVINRQSPNKQIWLSSPISGPKRYDFVPSRNGWVYRHDNKTLHGLLKEELSSIVKSPIDLSNCAYCGDFK